nr:hypothetical protein [Actinomycetota bacterium]
GRNTATAIARELLEEARAKTFATIGSSNWFDSTLQNVSGGSGHVVSPTAHSARTTVTRDKVDYLVEVDTCSVDDAKDGYGSHGSAAHWCTDSSGTAAADSQPEDMKRVAVTMSWTSPNGKAETLYQTATVGSTGQLVGPMLTDLTITKPTGLDQANPVIATNPTDPAGIARFLGVAAGAADMKWFVDGAEQQSGISGGSGNWTFDWNITSVQDGTYQISAVAVDALGTRGQPRVMNVKLARNLPTAPTNVTGGYNNVYVAGTKTQVVELMWDASPEGSVTGYEVWRGTTNVCAASLKTECMDLSAPTTGSTTYTIKTLYTDGAGNPGSVSTDYTVTAPSSGSGTIATRYYARYDTANVNGTYTGTGCKGGTVTSPASGLKYDALSTQANFTAIGHGGNKWFSACLPPFSGGVAMSAGTMTLTMVWRNGDRRVSCPAMPFYLYLNGTTVLAGQGVNGGGSVGPIPANTGSTTYTINYTTSPHTFTAGDQLSIYMPLNASCPAFLEFSSTLKQFIIDLPLAAGGTGGSITRPSAPTGLTATSNGDGTTTLTWTPPTGSPAAEFYRIYRDGSNYTERFDTSGDTGEATISWTDTDAASSHTYRVTAVSSVLAESDPAGPVTR